MKLSIITVNLNNRDGLQKTIDSVVSQTFRDFEWIVIDGGSTDGSKELIEQYAGHFSYWVSEPDKGIYNAMNKGIKVAKGEYLQFLNSGDCLYDNEVLEKFIQRSNTEDVIYGNAVIVDSQGNEISRWNSPEILKISNILIKGLNHQATFFSERCFEHFLYNEGNRIASDSELLMTLLYNSFSFAKFDEYIVKFDNTGISSVITSEDIKEIEDIYNRLLPPGVRADYDEIIMFQDVDLAIMIKTIIRSNKFFRHLTRIFVYPIYYLCKYICKE